MREIKFRAWDKNSKTFVTLELVHGEYNFMVSPPSFYDLEPWQQFTGLKDKNGKEIYEEDILKLSRRVGHLGYLEKRRIYWNFLVKWSVDGFSLFSIRKNVERHFGLRPFVKQVEPRLEVIGNIYENPELINK